MKLFIDIETVPGLEDPTTDLNHFGLFQKKFEKDFELHPSYDDWIKHYWEKAGLYAEFGKIVCVSMGYINGAEIVLKSYAGEDERQILLDVAAALKKAFGLVAHNGKNFDYPWLCRRMLIHGIHLPPLLQIQNLKPWEVKLEDTMEMWRFGQFNATVSLACLCSLFGIPSSKTFMDGSLVADAYYKGRDLQKIVTYCEADIVALINVYQKMNYLEPVKTPILL